MRDGVGSSLRDLFQSFVLVGIRLVFVPNPLMIEKLKTFLVPKCVMLEEAHSPPSDRNLHFQY